MKCYNEKCTTEEKALEKGSFVQINYSDYNVCTGCNRPQAESNRMAYFCSVECAVGVDVTKRGLSNG